MSFAIGVEFVCSKCEWKLGPVRPQPVSPDAVERPCYVACAACATGAEVFGDPNALAFACGACGSSAYAWLTECPRCRATIDQRMVPL